MADRWIALCRDESREGVRAAVRRYDANAILTFAYTPEEFRRRIQESPSCLGAVVGPLDGGMSPLNVAAAIARDAMAAEVMLVSDGMEEEASKRAQQAGIDSVVDIQTVVRPTLVDLDEPQLSDDEVPTMVSGIITTGGGGYRLSPQTRPWEIYAGNQSDSRFMDAGEEEPGTQILSFPSFAARMAKDEAKRTEEKLHHSNEGIDVESPDTTVLAVDGVGPAIHDSECKESAPIMTFVSGRGGVGKTSVVAIMAVIAASWHMKVAVCDLDLSCGNLHSLFGTGNVADLSKMVETPALESGDVASMGYEVLPGITLWGSCERPETAELVYPHTGKILSTLSRSADVVLVDTSTTFTDAVAQAAQQCDRLVITVDDRPGSTAAQARLASLAVRLGVARTRIVRLANRCGPHGKGEPSINRAEIGLETARPLRVLDGGMDVSDCFAEGRAEELMDLGSKFAESASTALATLLNELGCLPDDDAAQRALETKRERSRWTFGRKREAM